MTFTADEEDVARQHADQHGGILVPLPVRDPVWDWDAGRWREPDSP
ncbi:hypothetical protein E3G68_005119 [Mycobacteroides abscessus]|nr:hypothetical protein [Mycobacteroides abscessus]